MKRTNARINITPSHLTCACGPGVFLFTCIWWNDLLSVTNTMKNSGVALWFGLFIGGTSVVISGYAIASKMDRVAGIAIGLIFWAATIVSGVMTSLSLAK
jgi:hypothetical protein